MKPGYPCDEAFHCIRTSTCVNGICRLNLGQPCSDLNENIKCIPGLICKEKCLIDVNNSCKNAPDSCTADAICENDICKKKLDSKCSRFDDCIKGTYCENGYCRYNLNFSK